MFTVINGFGDYSEIRHKYIRMLPTPNNQGVFIFTKIGTYELSCDTDECIFQKSPLKQKRVESYLCIPRQFCHHFSTKIVPLSCNFDISWVGQPS